MESNQRIITEKNNKNDLTIRDFIYICLEHWKWFLLTTILALSLAVLYIIRKQPVFTRTAELLIKDSSGGSSFASQLSGIADLGMFNSSSVVDNELIALKSPYVVQEVVKRLKLDVSYVQTGFKKLSLYADTQPVEVSFDDLDETTSASMKMNLRKDGTFELQKFKKKKDKYDDVIKGKVNSTIQTPIGKLTIKAMPALKSMEDDEVTLKISKYTLNTAREKIEKVLMCDIEDKLATVIQLSYKDVSIQRANDIINTLIAVYQEYWVDDKNVLASATSRFIDARLDIIQQELGNVDNTISNYKSRNLVPDLAEAAKMYMTNANEASAQLVKLKSQLYLVGYIKDFMNKNGNKQELLPNNLIPEAPALETQISEYNRLLMQRNNVALNSSENNPLVADYDKQLKNLWNAIQASVNNTQNNLNIQIKEVEKRENRNNSLIASNPAQATHLLSSERQQKVKEALYIYLLQKREENELSQAFTAYNTRVLTPPMGVDKPDAPKKIKTLLAFLLLGLFIPAAYLYLKEVLDTKVRGKKDLEKLDIPFLGELPECESNERKAANQEILVKPHAFDIMNEAFRVVRTNLEFMASSYNHAKVIMVTSINPSSGKTFVTVNLAAAFAIKDKRVLVIDIDVRKGAMGRYLKLGMNSRGVTNLISGQESDWKSLIVHPENCQQLDVLPCGTLPPNPSELLANGQLGKLMDQLREHYDYIFLDSAPVEVVADTSVISSSVDMTIFVTRVGVLDKELLPVINNLYTNKKLKNMTILLNGAVTSKDHRFGYGYGYGYGTITKK